MSRIRRYIQSPVLLGGLIAGTIDIGAACLINKAPPLVIMQAIAAGLLGRASFRGGLQTAALGLLLQWAMSVLIAAIFALAAGRFTALKERWIASGVAYGVVVYFVMNYVVVPLSAAAHATRFNAVKIAENLLAMLLFGLIIAFFARRISRPAAPHPGPTLHS
jgi:uncharacterized membrane protein YagU involved in acid resistance